MPIYVCHAIRIRLGGADQRGPAERHDQAADGGDPRTTKADQGTARTMEPLQHGIAKKDKKAVGHDTHSQLRGHYKKEKKENKTSLHKSWNPPRTKTTNYHGIQYAT